MTLLHGVSKQASLLHTEWHIMIAVTFYVKVTLFMFVALLLIYVSYTCDRDRLGHKSLLLSQVVIWQQTLIRSTLYCHRF